MLASFCSRVHVATGLRSSGGADFSTFFFYSTTSSSLTSDFTARKSHETTPLLLTSARRLRKILLRGLSKFIHGIHAERPRGALAASALWRRLGLRSCLRRICSNRTHGARRPCTGMCTDGQSWDARARERPSPWHLLARVHTPLCSTLTTSWLQAGLRRPVLDNSQNGHSRVRAP